MSSCNNNTSEPNFGQAVIGAPGSGKSTYCSAMSDFLRTIKRLVAVVNLDPANDYTNFEPQIDIRELITIEDAMEFKILGPNGALLYCIEYLEQNIDWLCEKLNNFITQGYKYYIFDFPGQIELFTHHRSVYSILNHLEKSLNFRLTAVNLVDSFYCSDSSKYIAALLTSLSTMLKVENLFDQV
ncbi:GPN-loop GTPase QQT1-like [Octopus sinensis]|uniref:GPN-loop GTPase 2 n=1 Tax=Octopus sinensis TaxID=2607531 RepID=A0A6P7TYF8_9MOLL|nr:GPN-loop GTPase QQT1-like [Octopus sinensis]